jgi:serine protease Do
MGSSEELKVGDWVVAIGSPFSFDFSVTAGIVSAKGRSIQNQNIGGYVPFIQTDVAINPGNSGGPLFNLDGEVVGINSQIYSRSGGYQGVSFSIPIDVAIEVADQIISFGEVARGFLGVRMGDVDSDLAQALGMKKPYGALINSIEKDGAADDGGLKTGDVIIEFAGEEVKFAGDLPHIVGRKLPGTKSTAKVVRNGKTIKLDFVLGKLESSNSTFVPASSTENEYPLGIKVEDLPDDYEAADQGVMVSKVDNSSNSATKILEGDVITDIQSGFQRYSVRDSDSFNDIVSKFQSGDKIAIFGLRENSRFIVPITVD